MRIDLKKWMKKITILKERSGVMARELKPGMHVRTFGYSGKMWHSPTGDGPPVGEICTIREVQPPGVNVKINEYRYQNDVFLPGQYFKPMKLMISYRDILCPQPEWVDE
jgi:hypothetical protein